MNPVAIVLNGTSSAGKSSIAKSIQRQSSMPILHAQLDTFLSMFDWPTLASIEEKDECFRNCVANFYANLSILAASPYMLVVDQVFEQQEWFKACKKSLKSKKTYFIGIHCPLDEFENRELLRGDRRIGIAKGQFDSIHFGKKYDLELDSSITTPDECASTILQFILKEEQAIP